MQINTTDNGTSITSAPLSTTLTNQVAPGLLRNAIDERIVKIRPMATPIDQLSRCAGARHCNAMRVDYYAVDVKPVETKLKRALATSDISTVTDSDTNKATVNIVLHTNSDQIFAPSETLLIPAATVGGKTVSMTLYVLSVDGKGTGGVTAIWIDPVYDDGDLATVSLPADTRVVRMGRAAAELDVQTAQFEALPKKRTNNCQIFKMQVEQSTFQKLANKEVGWSFSDQEEVAIIDMRQGMEKNFIFGTQGVLIEPTKHEEIYLTGGIWSQTDKTFNYTRGTLTAGSLIDLCRKAFTGASGATRKILVAGTGLVNALSKLDYDKTLAAGTTFTKWGIEFNEIRSNFGSLYVLCSEIFDQCGHADDGFVLDPDCLTKYCHVPFHTETLDLRRSGVRNTDAIVITEASCLVLRHPQAHMRVIATD